MNTQKYSTERTRLVKSFFVAWLLDSKLSKNCMDEQKETDGSISTSSIEPAIPRGFSSEDLAPGQIRVLSQTSILTYVAILAKWDSKSFLFAPFSRFCDPATDEELKTVFQGGFRMGVLQIWNARTAMEATLRKSWLVGTLPEQDVKDALLLWKWSIGDVAELPERISERTGVPIYRTDDPRLEYRREALENFAAFDAEDDANAEREENEVPDMSVSEDFWARMRKLGFVCRIAEKGPMRAAAASVSSANPRKTFFVEGVPAKLRVEYSPSAKTLLFSAWDKERRVKTAVLDGFELVVETRSDPVPVRDKGARVPVPEPSAEFVLRNHEGRFVKLAEER